MLDLTGDMLCVFTVHWVLQSDCWELPEGQRWHTQAFCVSQTSPTCWTRTWERARYMRDRIWSTCRSIFACLCVLCSLRRFSIQPVCGELQSEILKCYKENTGKTLTCSGIASAYMQCVNDAKKVRLHQELLFLLLPLSHLTLSLAGCLWLIWTDFLLSLSTE